MTETTTADVMSPVTFPADYEFRIARYLVAVREWARFVTATRYETTAEKAETQLSQGDE